MDRNPLSPEIISTSQTILLGLVGFIVSLALITTVAVIVHQGAHNWKSVKAAYHAEVV
jgi:hypothetical protein